MDSSTTLPFSENSTHSLSGVEAISLLPFLSAARDKKSNLDIKCFISGYPGSPLGGLDLALFKHKKYFKDNSIVFNPGLNEEIAASSVMGSQFATSYEGFAGDGVLGIWYAKAPGLERAMDALRHGVYGGTGGNNSVILFVGDDPASNSSSIPTSSSNLLADMNIPVIYPGNVDEIIPLSLHAINISRLSGLWTALKITTSVADSFTSLSLNSSQVPLVNLTQYPDHSPLTTALDTTFLGNTNTTERTILQNKLPLVIQYLNNTPTLNKVLTNPTNPSLGIIISGNTYYAFLEALTQLGLDLEFLQGSGIKLLKLDVIFPLSPKAIEDFSQDLDCIIVIEEKKNFIEQQVLSIISNTLLPTKVYGKNSKSQENLVPSFGLLNAAILKDIIPLIIPYSKYANALPETTFPSKTKYLPLSLKETNPKRIPSLCSGCPHSTSLQLPQGSLFGAGVGCHALGMFMDEKIVGNAISSNAMGVEGSVWIGASPFLPDQHLFQNMGDGTYFHSGSLALRACIDSGVNITFKILYNSSIAMTGGQKVPGSIQITNLIKELEQLEISKIVLATNSPISYKKFKFAKNVQVKDITEINSIQEELSKYGGVTVLISDLECALALKSKRRKIEPALQPDKIVINSRICENCGDCGAQSSCLSLQQYDTDFGTKVTVDQSSCNQAQTCLKGNCPAFIKVPATALLPVQSLTTKYSLETLIPLPEKISFNSNYNVVMPGVGGTGVIHASKLLGLASKMEGLNYSGSDSTGLAQKSGSVTSFLKISKTSELLVAQRSDNIVDLVLGFDISVTSNSLPDYSFRDTCNTILSSTITPTGNMVYNPDLLKKDYSYEISKFKSINQGVKPKSLNSSLIAKLTGNDSLGNMVLLGAALQSGYLPVSYYSLLSAIKNSNSLVSQNIDALNLGRLWVHDSSYLNNLLDSYKNYAVTPKVKFNSEDLSLKFPNLTPQVLEKVALYSNELQSYHSRTYALKYQKTLIEIFSKLLNKFPDLNLSPLYQTITQLYYNLLAFKDEYEVARLTLLSTPSSLSFANLDTASKYNYQWKLPFISYQKSFDKTNISSNLNFLILALSKFKFLRFTPFNPFYYNTLRAHERALPKRYLKKLNLLLDSETSTLDEIQLLNNDAMKIKGFAQLKLDLILKYLP